MAFARFRDFLYKANVFHFSRNVFCYSTMTESFGKTPRRNDATRLLFRRISPVGDPTASVVPILDHWIQEGREVNKTQLTGIIKELRSYRRYGHALQISMWMSEKRYISLTPPDISVRLDLISKVHGIEEAESYFNNIPVHLRTLEVYCSLLNCYTNAKSVERAENLMQNMRDLGLARGPLVYTVLLSLYQQIGNNAKVQSLIQEMEENQIRFTNFTYSVLIRAHAAKSDTCGIDEILAKYESDSAYGGHWSVYSTAAEGYLEARLADKAISALRKAEKGITNDVKDRLAYNFIISQYAKAGCRDDVLRVCKIFTNRRRITNKGYICIISSLLKLDDIESAEQVFEEWKSKDLYCDIKIPNFLIGYYCRKGRLEKADATLKEMVSRGAKLNPTTWYYMAIGYLQEGLTRKAVQALKESLKVCVGSKWVSDKDTLSACLEFLKQEGDIEGTKELLRLIEDQGIASPEICLRLLDYVRK